MSTRLHCAKPSPKSAASPVSMIYTSSLTSGVNALSVHAVLGDGASYEGVLEAVRRRVTSDFNIAHATVQVEAKSCEPSQTHC